MAYMIQNFIDSRKRNLEMLGGVAVYKLMIEIFKGAMSAGEHALWGYANYFQLSKFYCF